MDWKVRALKPGRQGIIRTVSDGAPSPPSRFYDVYQVFVGGKMTEGVVSHLPPSSIEIINGYSYTRPPLL